MSYVSLCLKGSFCPNWIEPKSIVAGVAITPIVDGNVALALEQRDMYLVQLQMKLVGVVWSKNTGMLVVAQTDNNREVFISCICNFKQAVWAISRIEPINGSAFVEERNVSAAVVISVSLIKIFENSDTDHVGGSRWCNSTHVWGAKKFDIPRQTGDE